MKIIGITGPTGSGKSLLGKIFCEHNIPSIDADRVYHDMLIPPSDCLDAIRLTFGDGVFSSDGSLDRAKLGSVVFNSPKKLELLNSTVLSMVIARIDEMISEYKKNNVRAVAIDAPTLIESGFNKKCHTVISVLAPKELRTKRIIERDSISNEQAELRVKAQKSDTFYIENSDYVLNNTEDYEQFREDAVELFKALDIV